MHLRRGFYMELDLVHIENLERVYQAQYEPEKPP